MKIPTQQELLDYINKHLEKTGEKPSIFGRRVLGDSAAIIRLMQGTDPRLSTVRKIVRTIEGSK